MILSNEDYWSVDINFLKTNSEIFQKKKFFLPGMEGRYLTDAFFVSDISEVKIWLKINDIGKMAPKWL